MIRYTFIPRDAGFFSVFNFLIGSIANNECVYPYFNKQALLSMHGSNQHFSYWTDSENCWFDYFEPIQYFDNDFAHVTGEYLFYPKYSGEQCSVEFRIPSETKKLLKDNPEQFKKWRQTIHSFYKKYIKFKKSILDEIDLFWNNYFNLNDSVIGVHYRHPSHFIESGKIYLEQYFTEIDRLLAINPESKIFLASDSQFGIYAFLEKYNNKIYYISDIDRLSMSEFLHWCFGLADGNTDHVGFINGKGYELHHSRINKTDNKKMTIDLFKEVLCLSKCNYLINTISNIPLAISYINPEVEIITL